MINNNDDFLILENDDGELMLSIPAKEGSPDTPKMIVSEERNAILYRGSKDIVFLEGIHPEIIKKMFSINEMLVGEVENNNDFKHIYTSRIIKVDKLPNINKGEV